MALDSVSIQQQKHYIYNLIGMQFDFQEIETIDRFIYTSNLSPIHLIFFVHNTEQFVVVVAFLWCSYDRNEIPYTKYSSWDGCTTLVILL